jgi:hypothetical protein
MDAAIDFLFLDEIGGVETTTLSECEADLISTILDVILLSIPAWPISPRAVSGSGKIDPFSMASRLGAGFPALLAPETMRLG